MPSVSPGPPRSPRQAVAMERISVRGEGLCRSPFRVLSSPSLQAAGARGHGLACPWGPPQSPRHTARVDVWGQSTYSLGPPQSLRHAVVSERAGDRSLPSPVKPFRPFQVVQGAKYCAQAVRAPRQQISPKAYRPRLAALAQPVHDAYLLRETYPQTMRR